MKSIVHFIIFFISTTLLASSSEVKSETADYKDLERALIRQYNILDDSKQHVQFRSAADGELVRDEVMLLDRYRVVLDARKVVRSHNFWSHVKVYYFFKIKDIRDSAAEPHIALLEMLYNSVERVIRTRCLVGDLYYQFHQSNFEFHTTKDYLYRV